ncbi:MAG: hypothetical protein ACREDR_38275 [Blastocatellia bacterium]
MVDANGDDMPMNEEESLAQYIKTAMEDEPYPPGIHFTEDQMISFCRSGESGNQLASGLRAHLVQCDKCVRLFKDVHDFIEPARAEEHVATSTQTAAAWKALRNQLPLPGPGSFESRLEKRRRFSAMVLAPALAAAVVLITALGAVWIVRLKAEQSSTARKLESDRQSYLAKLNDAEQENQRLRTQEDATRKEYEQKLNQQKKLEGTSEPGQQGGTGKTGSESLQHGGGEKLGVESEPVLNVPLIDVFPADSIQRSGSSTGTNQASVSAKLGSFVLILNAGGQSASYSSYRVEILDQSGRIVWRGTGLKRDQTGNFTLMLSRAITPHGSYTIRLYGESGPGEPISEYKIKVD